MNRLRTLSVLTLTASVCLLGTTGASASEVTDRADRALDRALERLVAAKAGAPGVIAVVQRGNNRVVHTAGVAELEGKAPKATMAMRLASASKAFSGAVSLALVADGKLELDDTIAELLPKLPTDWGEVTLQQALTHTSGIPTFTRSKEFAEAFTKSPERGPKDPAELLSYVADEKLEFAPGSKFEYSNSDNIVVALMVEAATGKSYRAALKQYVTRGLRLRGTSLPSTTNMPSPYIHGYDVTENPPEDLSLISSPDWSSASGGLVSTPTDLNVFARGYASAELFGRKVQRQQFQFVNGSSEPPGPGRNSAGAGIFRYRTDCGTVYGHTGNIFGYTQFFAASKNGRSSVTVSASAQITPDTSPRVFKILLDADEKAVCAALAR